jgi:hypothetical protein
VNGFLGAFSLLYALVSWVPRLSGTTVVQVAESERTPLWHTPTLLIGLIGLAGYLYLLIPVAGFFAASVLYAFGVVAVLRLRVGRVSARSLGSAAVFAVVLASVIQYLFDRVLNVHLPPGMLF